MSLQTAPTYDVARLLERVIMKHTNELDDVETTLLWAILGKVKGNGIVPVGKMAKEYRDRFSVLDHTPTCKCDFCFK